MPIYKNQPRTIAFQSVQTSGSPNTTVTPSVQISLDGAAPFSPSGTPVSVGNGYWKISLLATEMNADLVVLTATASNCYPSQREIYTESDWSSTRAAKMDNLDAAISTRSTFAGGAVASVASPVTVGGYSAGKDPGSLVLHNPSQLLNTDTGGNVSVYANYDKNGYGLRSSDSDIIQSGVVQASTSNTLTLVGGDGHDGIYVGCRVEIVSGTGYGQARTVTGYVASTQSISVDRPWTVVPDSTSAYQIRSGNYPRVDGMMNTFTGGYASGMDPTSALLNTGYTSTRAAALDNIDARISSRSTYAGGPVASVGAPVTVGGYSSGQDPASLMTIAGYTSTRASLLDHLDQAVSTRLASTAYVVPPSTTQIASALLVSPSNKLSTDSGGCVALQLNQSIPLVNTPQTLGDSLNAARAQGFGAWQLDVNSKTLTLLANDGTTAVRTFTLDSVTSPTARR